MNEFLRRVLFLPPQASTLAREIDTLHYAVISVTMAGATLVALAAAYFILRYRRRPTREPAAPVASAGLHVSPQPMPIVMAFWFELLVIAFLLTLFVVWWVIGFRQFVKLETPPKQAMEIYVTAKQWMWTFAYPNGRTSNAVLYVPANRPVTLLLSSRDVIHSFFVPHFRVKKDVIPGRMTTLWFEATEPGAYPVYCTEYCGEGHSTMRARVIALREHEYLAKLEQLPRLDIGGPNYVEPAVAGSLSSQLLSLAEMGERVAVTKGCTRCHTVDGTPHIGPTWLGLYHARVTLVGGERPLADEAYLTESMMDPRARVRAGFQPVMPTYQGLLSAAETGALLEYMRYLSTADPELRLSPLAPRGSPPLTLPSVAPQALERNRVPQPLRVIPEPRPDAPPFSPPGTEPSHLNVERIP